MQLAGIERQADRLADPECERGRRDGLDDLAAMIHSHGASFDLWTLDAGTPRWEERLRLAVDLGADVITTNTPRVLARADL